MIHSIRISKFSKIIASYLAIQLIFTTVQPSSLYALTGGPAQPEFNSFTPIGTSDMVNLASGDFNYNIPIMDIGGYPINLSYDSGVTMDQEASWVGLGWNLNVGQINRQVRGLPDDFNGDEMRYQNNLKDNKTVGATVTFHPAVIGVDIPVQINGTNTGDSNDSGNVDVALGLGVDYNNYTGWSYSATSGVSFKLSDNVTIGAQMTNSSTQGVSISPSLSLNTNTFGTSKFSIGSSVGTKFNSRQGLTNLSINPSLYSAGKKIGMGKYINGGSTSSKSFLPTSYTPQKRNQLVNVNSAANAALGFEVFGVEGQGEIYVYASEQSLADEEKDKVEKAYGFNFTENASKNDILDLNRENDRVITKNVNVLPVTNYTYDMYSINGQGISGMYQPYRSQVGYVNDKYVKDISKDRHLGIEVGGGAYVHVGVEYRSAPSESFTGLWSNNNFARANFIENTGGPNKAYEKLYYKTIGELNVDPNASLFENQLGGEEPIKLELTGSNFAKETVPNRYLKGSDALMNVTSNFQNGLVKRSNRLIRNQAIQTINGKEANNLFGTYDDPPQINPLAQEHHNVATKITQPDGSTYVFGQPAYNTKKVEATFNVTGRGNGGTLASEELVKYESGDNSANNSRGRDNYFNRVETPAYVHTYLLSEVLSSDYEDLTGNGPTDDDLGSYTKIHYTDHNTASSPYKWRVPFDTRIATANKGFNSLQQDNMGNYIYGEKELFYVDKIETKTHIAVFQLNERNDGYGVNDENGGLSQASKMFQLDKIYLYSKPVYENLTHTTAFENLDDLTKVRSAIKVAHFEYDYSLCEGVPNNASSTLLDTNELDDQGGKLTLKKVYFTYRGSNMGKYTPYEFNYDGLNPDYHIKGYNMWGNYKDPMGPGMGLNHSNDPTTAEFPYVDQKDREVEDENAAAWTMTSVNLPSGGKIQMTYEADDYRSVQDKRVLQMFKVRGVGNTNTANGLTNASSNELYHSTSGAKRFIYVELPNEDPTDLPAPTEFIDSYLSELIDKPIFFKFLLNMDSSKSYAYDFVSGYFKLDHGPNKDFSQPGREINIFSNTESGTTSVYAAIPVQLVHKNKSSFDDDGESPFSKAGWYFGRQHMNRIVYGQSEVSNFNILDIAETIVGQIGGMFALFNGPNNELKQNGVAKKFSTTKSWVRLQNPNLSKIGGGIRVTRVEMFDEWDVMTGNANNDLYRMSYGQEYDYTGTDGITSGVASFEPFGSKENPFVEPFYDDVDNDRLLAPQEQNFTEKPFGISFFPSPKVTYGRVTVSNLNRGTYDNGSTVLEVGNNGTGRVVNEFYTSKDFPTIAKHTPLGSANIEDYPDGGVSFIASMFGLNFETKKRISMSQGFMVITNDMDGKPKNQMVFQESAINDNSPISKVEYIYNVDDDGKLYHKLPVIKSDGTVETSTLGLDYNVINDFRRSKSAMETYGGDVNIAVLPSPAFGIPFTIGSATPQLAFHDTDLRMATTTKVIHKTGILIEKKATDLGAVVTTKNIAWDAQSGQVLLTETDNEYEDKYYNFNFPAYWHYNQMGAATKNVGLELNLNYIPDHQYNVSGVSDLNQYLSNGDQLLVDNENIGWITNLTASNFSIINRDGLYVDSATKFKIIRSGYRNLQSANMASITLMQNPIDLDNNFEVDGEYDDISTSTFEAGSWEQKRIVNASAVQYSDNWILACDCSLPQVQFDDNGELIIVHQGENAFNPYLYNVRGEWRANESFAYLTGRYNNDQDFNPRNSGFFKDFSAFYKVDMNGNWSIDNNQWTSASEVTLYSPYGAELENKDALERFSAAQYGYNDNFPVAVASNSEYREIGFDGFEEERPKDRCSGHFFFYEESNDAELSDLASHTGNQSVKIEPNRSIEMRKTISKNCSSDDVEALFIDLMNELFRLNKLGEIPQNQCFSIPELEALSDYIDLPNGDSPQICNFVSGYTGSTVTIGFSFSPNNQEPNAPMPYDSSILDKFYDVAFAEAPIDPDYGYPILTGLDYEESGMIGSFYLGATYSQTNSGDGLKVRNSYYRYLNFNSEERCPSCTSFSPKMNESYVLSSWVKVDIPNNGSTPEELLASQPLEYGSVGVLIEFLDDATQPINNLNYELFPEGSIIDGWQRIAGTFSVPQNSDITYMRVKLINSSQHQAFFDDVRIHPYSGTMKSFVYDNENYRLMAELDENNFATFYEYDQEGGLIRVKKETERGVMTIQETRSGTSISN